jgi:adenine-specific DNA-methyltransferase
MVEKESDKLIQIEEAIQSFNNKKLYESSIAFFKSLDYQSNKTAQLSSNNYDGFIDSFNLSKNAINKDKAFEGHWKYIEFIFQVADSEITRVQSLFDTGEVDSNEYQSFLFFTIKIKEDNYKRGDLVKITRELNVPFKMPVIVLFNYGNKLTLSIIDRRLHKKDTSKDILEKVTLIKDIDIANPQRAHKEILKDLSLSELYKKFEFHSFVKLHEAWKATLNISELNKKFYKELAYWYFWALQEVRFPDDELKDDKTRNPVNVIRLITRLIFVWFLKEKNLIPDDLFNKRELDKILDYKDKTGSTYYKAILQNLFFATLNTEMNKDVKDKNKISRTFVNRNTGVPHYFRYSRFIKDQNKFAKWMDNIPFLNGGLFECLDKRTKDKDIFIDGFTQQLKNESTVKVPDYLFFSEAPRNIDLNNTFHTKGKKYEVRGLIDILSRYKFTIEENTPVEEEVALDPELLGKVFENLLASYNEETETTARKLTGSFYTPREIVNYMVDESLITYLCNCLLKEDDENKREELNERLHHLFSYTAEEPQFADDERKELIDAIDNCKILDPACGSGAFPMGILHKLVFILSKLDPNNKKWKQKQQDKAKRDMVLAEKMEDDKNRDAAIKEIDLRIKDIDRAFNQNNHELDFARKLYLIENCIYGVDKQPVAIQISKLRFFIALIVDQKTENDSEPNRGIRPLPNLETKFVAADTLVSIEKPVQLTLMNQDEKLQKEIRDKEEDIHRVREKHFRARTPDTKEKYRLLDAKHRNELALLLERDGFPKAATKQLAGWNPYDQNKFADFFDPMWMFEIDKGFDIVIGNPPYVQMQKNSGKLAKELQKFNYKTFEKTGDLYAIFYERGIQILKEGGIETYITSSQWTKAAYGKSLRKYFLSKNPLKLILLGPGAFESATVDTNILVIQNRPNKNQLVGTKIDTLIQLGDEASHNLEAMPYVNEETWAVSDISKQGINQKIIGIGKPLKNWRIHIYRGVLTGFNEAFIIEEEKRKELIKTDPQSKEIIKPILRGREIGKYLTEWDGGYLINTHNGIKSQSIEPVKIKSYPAIKKHLDIFKEQINSRLDQGVTPYNLRNCAYLKEFTKQKLIWKRIGSQLRFSYSEKEIYCLDSTCIATGEKIKYLACLLNSRISNYQLFENAPRTGMGDLIISVQALEPLLVYYPTDKEEHIFNQLLDFILHQIKQEEEYYTIENIMNGCVYELYFGEEMKKAGVDILALVEKDLEAVKKLSPEKAIAKLYEKWQEPKNEVRNRLLLMATRCPETIGVIEASIN